MTKPRPLYETSAQAHGGRAGHVDSPDGQLQVRLAVPEALGGDGGSGSTPEQLFAAALAACFESAMGAAARAEQYPEFGVMKVLAVVGLVAQGDAHDLQVALDITLPGLSRAQAGHLVERAQTICAYSRALASQIEYRLHDA
ncbi:Ohr subfamily peroxiredoxin [Deinococcus irradiatisoli]|uniref:Ohr subfamily peroxiredoxin n=1 Tax=Deinococcus irradiatisoli TaxID=2202254 RepID=A0A2Z3JN10_9DEIO|nr:Ohr family peroxiredoxin [Deinococcus irradiatisoli]AWN22594.1 Ohr subfamily peroxiredoxin [Deinococcus irradiatisoli]